MRERYPGKLGKRARGCKEPRFFDGRTTTGERSANFLSSAVSFGRRSSLWLLLPFTIRCYLADLLHPNRRFPQRHGDPAMDKARAAHAAGYLLRLVFKGIKQGSSFRIGSPKSGHRQPARPLHLILLTLLLHPRTDGWSDGGSPRSDRLRHLLPQRHSLSNKSSPLRGSASARTKMRAAPDGRPWTGRN